LKTGRYSIILGLVTEKLKHIFFDKTAIVTTVVGIMLLTLTIVWHVNPAEASVVPSFLLHTVSGKVIHMILLVTCMPAWFAATLIFFPIMQCHGIYTHHEVLMTYILYILMLIIQGLLFFAIGKLISLCIRTVKKPK
jgi:uncharacterized membrane protein